MIRKQIGKEIYSFKFGIKCLILSKDFLKLENKQKKRLLFKDILIEKQELDKLFNLLSDSCIEQIIVATFEDAFLVNPLPNNCSFYLIQNFIFSESYLQQVDQLYMKAVGEIGISPSVFFQMTPKEIELAYMGYIKRMELGANCALAAARRSRTSNGQLISLLHGQEYGLSTLEEREATFKILHIS